MLYLKPANIEDIEKEHAFVAAEPADENGFLNNYHDVSFEDFKAITLPRMLAVPQSAHILREPLYRGIQVVRIRFC